MLHQELVRAATVLAAFLFCFYYFMKPEREAAWLKRDCGIRVEPAQITDEIRKECHRYLREMAKHKP